MSKNNRELPLWQQPGWSLFFSIRTGLVLLTLLAAASIYGTLIPSLVDKEGHELVSALERSQTMVFYSWWYKLLLLALAVNISCATLRQLLEKVLPGRRPRFMHGLQFYKTSPNAGDVPYRGSAETVAAAFRGRGFHVALEGAYGHVTRGLLGRWGSPISHLGFVIVLLGGFASAWVSREGVLQLVEGEQNDMMLIQKKPTLEEMRKIATGEMEEPKPIEEPLGFTLRCEDFQTGFFPKTRIPSHFKSLIAIRLPGCFWDVQPVEVNHSPAINGWILHQTSYNEAKELTRYQLALAGPDHPSTLTLNVSPGQRRLIPGLGGTEVELTDPPTTWTILKREQAIATGTLAGAAATGGSTLRAVQFEPDFVMDMENHTVGSKSQQLNNPALRVSVTEGGQTETQWLFGRDDMKQMMKGMHAQQGSFVPELTQITGQGPDWKFQVTVRDTKGLKLGDFSVGLNQVVKLSPDSAANPTAPPRLNPALAGGWNVKIDQRVPAYMTLLTLTRNPAIPFVYAGCALMLLGLALAFGIRRREAWFWVDGAANRLRVAALGGQLIAGLDGGTQKILASLAEEAPLGAAPPPAEKNATRA